MATHSQSQAGATGVFWPFVNRFLAVLIAGFALYWGIAFVVGAFRANHRISAAKSGGTTPPAPPSAPAAPSTAAGPAQPAAAAAPATANASLPLAEITIKPGGASGLEYDTKSFSVKAGQKVRLTFSNSHPIPQPHNWVLGKPGSKDKLIAAAMQVMTDPNALAKGYIPENSPDMITHTKLLQPGQSDTIEFVAGPPADYPYICTFPGHAITMNGVMKVE